MPFTFAHPAAILPFQTLGRKYFSSTGLFVGSLVLDFEYFIRFNDAMHWSHSWWGLFCFDLPVGLLLCFLFHNILRDILLPHLPRFIRAKLPSYKPVEWNRYFAKKFPIIIFSLLLGATLHIGWDALTHFCADSLLRTTLLGGVEPGVRDILIYYSIWFINSLAGFVALALWFYKLPKVKREKRKLYFPDYWALTFVVALFVTIGRFVINSEWGLIDLADTCISAMLIGMVVSSIICKRRINLGKGIQFGVFKQR